MKIDASTINKVYNNNTFRNLMTNLLIRWMNESSYEDINTYAEPIKKEIDRILPGNGFTQNIKMTKRPFGFKVVLPYTYRNGATISTTVVFSLTTSGSYTWTTK